MYWKTPDGTLKRTEDIVVILTMDFYVVMNLTEAEANEHRVRDAAVEFSLDECRKKLYLEEGIHKQLANPSIELRSKIILMGLWLMKLVRLTDEGKVEIVVPENIQKEIEEDNDEDDLSECPQNPVVKEDPKDVYKKQRGYIR